MMGEAIDRMVAAADAEEQARLRERYFPGVEGDITTQQVIAALPLVVSDIWDRFSGDGLPTADEVAALRAEHGDAAAAELLRAGFLGFVRSKLPACVAEKLGGQA